MLRARAFARTNARGLARAFLRNACIFNVYTRGATHVVTERIEERRKKSANERSNLFSDLCCKRRTKVRARVIKLHRQAETEIRGNRQRDVPDMSAACEFYFRHVNAAVASTSRQRESICTANALRHCKN